MAEFYWHVHHRVLFEPLVGTVEDRIKYIWEYKPAMEIATRLRLLKPVKGELPEEILKTQEACDKAQGTYNKTREEAQEARGKAWEACDKAQEAHDKAQRTRDKAIANNFLAVAALHRQECKDCPWDGETIFPACRSTE